MSLFLSLGLAVAIAVNDSTFGVGFGAGSAPGDTIAIVDVNVVPMDRERVLARQTVLIAGGRIAAMGERGRVRVPAGARRVDGAGKYLAPQLTGPNATGPFAQFSVRTPAAATQRVQEYAAAGYDFIKVTFGLTPEIYDAIATATRQAKLPVSGTS